MDVQLQYNQLSAEMEVENIHCSVTFPSPISTLNHSQDSFHFLLSAGFNKQGVTFVKKLQGVFRYIKVTMTIHLLSGAAQHRMLYFLLIKPS